MVAEFERMVQLQPQIVLVDLQYQKYSLMIAT